MLNNNLKALAFFFPAAIAVVACSAAPATRASSDDDKDSNSRKNDDDTDTAESNVTQKPTQAPVQTPVQTTKDAGVTTPPKPVEPTDIMCKSLMDCCGTLGLVEQIACNLGASENNKYVCIGALALCKSGYFDIGDVFGNNTECGDLAQCCGEMQTNGNTAASNTCQQWAQAGDKAACRTQYTNYKNARQCR